MPCQGAHGSCMLKSASMVPIESQDGLTSTGDRMSESAMDRIQDAVPLYEQYLEISRIAELPTMARYGEVEFYVPAPSPLTLTISTR